MAGRNIPPQHLLRPHPTQLEELAALQHRKIQSLLVDNQRLAATHVALKQELALSHQELRHLSGTLNTVKLESDAQVREVYEKAVKLEGEVRFLGEYNVELGRVREDVRTMEEDRRELVGKFEEVEAEVRNARVEVGEVERVREEIEVMRREVLKGRAAIEYEKKLHATNVEMGQLLEENMVSMAREIEKLQAEIANAEKMERAAAAAAAAASPGSAYASGYGNSGVGYAANSYAGPYAAQQVRAPHLQHNITTSTEFQGNVGSGPQYRSRSAAHSPYGTQQNHVP